MLLPLLLLATAHAGKGATCVGGLERTTPEVDRRGHAEGRRFRYLRDDPAAVAYLTFWMGDLDGDGRQDQIAQSVTPGVTPHWIVVVGCGDDLVLLWKGEALDLRVGATQTSIGPSTWRDLERKRPDGVTGRLQFDGTSYSAPTGG